MKYSDIPQFPSVHYEVDISWSYLKTALQVYTEGYQLNLDPDFQRAHVWTRSQKIAYLEYCLRGGEVGRNITFNCPGWQSGRKEGPMVLVDGKQRLTAVLDFLADEVPIFGHKYSTIEGNSRWTQGTFKFRVCALETRKEVLQFYLNINAGGTPHTEAELSRVRELLTNEK